MTSGPLFTRLQQMFSEMVVPKDASLISEYYDPDFDLVSNGVTMDYDEFVRFHRDAYATDVRYDVRYDHDAVVEGPDQLAFRMFITTSWPDRPARELEVIGIATYRDGRLLRLWELTHPDWSEEERLAELL
jgi:hypothetical protein